MADTGWVSPSGNEDATITNPSNAYSSDDSYATAADDDFYEVEYKTFGFSIPSGATINGIEVRIEAKEDTSGTWGVYIYLSQDGGSTLSDSKYDTVDGNTDNTYLFGGPSDLWGETWSDTDFGSSFRVKFVDWNTINLGTLYLDHIQAKVYYTETTASVSPASLTTTIPSVTASYVDVDTASVSPLSTNVAIPSVTADEIHGVSVSPLSTQVTIPTIAAEEIQEASVSPLSAQVSIPAVTAVNYWQADVSPLSIQTTIPSVDLNYSQEGTDWVPVSRDETDFTASTVNETDYTADTKNETDYTEETKTGTDWTEETKDETNWS